MVLQPPICPYRSDPAAMAAARAHRLPPLGFDEQTGTSTPRRSTDRSPEAPIRRLHGGLCSPQGCIHRMPHIGSPVLGDYYAKQSVIHITQTRVIAGQRHVVDRSTCSARTDRHGRPRHGTVTAYNNFGCRCPDALAAVRSYKKHKRIGLAGPGRVPSIGTARRLQALAVAGYSTSMLARMTGLDDARINHLREHTYPTVLVWQAKLIAELYELLDESRVPPPQGRGPNRTRQHAARQGWLPPLAWDPDSIDDPDAKPATPGREVWTPTEADIAAAMRGEPISGPRAFRARVRREAIARLTRAGLTDSAIAERLRVSARTVERARAEARKTGQLPPHTQTTKKAA